MALLHAIWLRSRCHYCKCIDSRMQSNSENLLYSRVVVFGANVGFSFQPVNLYLIPLYVLEGSTNTQGSNTSVRLGARSFTYIPPTSSASSSRCSSLFLGVGIFGSSREPPSRDVLHTSPPHGGCRASTRVSLRWSSHHSPACCTNSNFSANTKYCLSCSHAYDLH